MDSATLSALEFDALKRLLAPHLRCEPGRRALADLSPGADAARIRRRKALAAESIRHHTEGGRLGPGSLDDPAPALARLRPEGGVLEPLEILRLVGLMQAADSSRVGLTAVKEQYPALWSLAGALPDFRGLTRALAGGVSSEGRLEDSASPDLGRIRRRIADLEAGLHRALQSIVDAGRARGLLQDAYVTIRSGRFVVPVRAEARSAVPGIVHGASSTGATLFVEPLQTIDLNNDLVELREQELAEIRRILSRWSDQLRGRLADLCAACEMLGDLDLINAIGVFGVSFGCTVAGESGLSDGPAPLSLIDARHPVLEAGLRLKGGSPIPLSVEMDARRGALVLSGPNAGGKTVALKTIGLAALMNQAGLPVPAREAVLPLFKQVLADIGDHQSILESLSTFSARMVRVAEMSLLVAPPALVLIDEVGAGTDPEEAGALAVAIVDHFLIRGAAIVSTTHHEAVKIWAESAPGAINACMEIDERTMRPTYRLIPGLSGRSGGIDLAERVGLPPQVVADARSRVSHEHRETGEYVARLHALAESRERELASMAQERERERSRAIALEEELKGEIAASREAWRKAMAAALDTIEQARETFIAGIRDRAIALQLRAEARRQSRTLRDQLESTLPRIAGHDAGAPDGTIAPAAGTTVRPGSRVTLSGIGGAKETATVESVDGRGRARLLVRGKRMTVDVSDLTPIDSPAQDGERRAWALPHGVTVATGDREAVAAEINVIGMTVDEATDRIDKFLDEAYMAGHRQVRIVHGHGTGRLRAAVQAMLSRHAHVESHAAASDREGGAGATVAAIRA